MQAVITPISILIVDDTKFSSAVVNKTLQSDGFTDIRVANSAIDGLAMLKERNADILIADWLMPGMDGLELTQLVRELNRRKKRFTYVLLLTAKEGIDDLKTAFERGVDDFVGKTNIRSHLIPRIHAAERIAQFQNVLLKRESALQKQFDDFGMLNKIDSNTGLGNLSFLEHQLGRYLKQQKGRNGNVGLLLCRLDSLPSQLSRSQELVGTSILKQASQRLQETARPMDDIALINGNTLALLIYGSNSVFIGHALLRRVQENVLNKAYATKNGYITAKGTIQFDIIETPIAAPENSAEMISGALVRLNGQIEGQNIHYWNKLSEPA